MPGAMNFITGGSPLGSSVFASAANKIVGFQRGAAGVAPKAPDLGSIISTLSSNILNNVQNQVQSVNQNVSNIINQTLKTFGQDYQNRLKQIDDAKPNRILSNFLKMYQQAIEYIQFLGNRKNIRTLGDNIQSLQRIFAETFEVAKIIRQTIIKIVKQLSNLPTASTGGGGLNLDVKVPGGPLRRSAPRGLNRMLKIAGTGAAIAGAGALGSKVVSGMMDIGDGDVQPVAGSGSEGLSGPVLDRFSAILDRFSAAIDSLSRRPTSKPSAPGGGSSTASPAAEKTAPGSPGSSGPGSYQAAGKIPEKVKQDTEFTSGISSLAKKYKIPEDYLYAVMGFETGGTFDPAIKNQAGSGATGLIQFMPSTAEGLGTSTDALSKMSRADQLKYVDKYFAGKGIEGGSLSDVYMSVLFPAAVGKPDDFVLFGKGAMKGYTGRAYTQNAGLDLNKDGSVTKAEASAKVQKYLPKDFKPAQGQPSSSVSSVAAAPTQAETAQQVSQTVAQPPPQQQSQVNVLPMNLGSAQPQQPQKSATPSSPPPAMSSGRNLINLSSTNHDNFLTLYSKMVYNIVDG